MCLPFTCGGGGGDRGDHGSPPHHGFHHPPPRPHPPPPLSPPARYVPSSEQVDAQADYKTFVATTPPFEEAYGQHAPGTMAAGGGKGMNGERMMAFDDSPYVRGRKIGAENVHVAPVLAAQQAPHHQRRDVYSAASPPLHGRPVTGAAHPDQEHTEKMRAPAVVQMARRGGEVNYSGAATTTPTTPVANNLYGHHGHAYGDEGNRKPNSWWTASMHPPHGDAF
ncbi:hypothetical protein HU200_002902 [Digitaria exilis]|uniref:Uncharacterized protein n=1 Tax=Digitaria exilis TaxID=1010633 RepID=A0A835FWC7_9POAL|nr:hypothetical protein HU200_002902 [Digitaria exilis]